MFKHEISYTDYNGQKRSEMFYFNLSRAELMEMELSTTNGVEEMIRMLIATKNNAEITRIYKELILKSVGIKSEDGRRFIKNQQIRDEFEQSEAYSEFFMQMMTNSQLQNEFINKVIAGTNVPNMDEKDALKKLKELGYDTTSMEEALEAQKNNVVPMNDKVTVDENK